MGTILKIILNHSQHINIIFTNNQIPLPWMENFFNFNDYLSFANDQAIANDCIIQKFYYHPQTHLIFREIVYSLMPLVFSILSYSIWLIIYFFKNKRKKQLTNIISKFIVFVFLSIFLFYSLNIKLSFGLFNCILLHDKSYLQKSPDIECWSEDHFHYILYFGLTGLLMWGIIFPLTLFYQLKKNLRLIKDKDSKNFLVSMAYSKSTRPAPIQVLKNTTSSKILEEKYKNIVEHSQIYSFFYKDYKPELYYWECLIFFRKFIITYSTTVSNVILNEGNFLLMIAITLCFCHFTSKYYPFKNKFANIMELISLIVCVITIFSICIFNSSTNINFQYLISFICIFSNVVFYVCSMIMVIFIYIFPIFKNQFQKILRKMKMFEIIYKTTKKIEFDSNKTKISFYVKKSKVCD